MSGAARILRRASAWNPLRWCFGPVFQKEMRVASRQRGTYWFRFAYALLLAMLVAITLWGILSTTRQREAALGNQAGSLWMIEALQTVAPAVTMVVGWMQYLILGLTMPSATAPSINSERRHRTMSALLSTPLSAAEIVLGKLTARLVLMSIVVLLGVPLLLAVRVLGGASASVVVQLMAVTLSTALVGASAGVMWSVWTQRSSAAMSLAMFTLLALHLGPAIVVAVSMFGPAAAWGQGVLFTTCSPAVMAVLSAELMAGAPPLGMGAWWMHSLYNVAWSAIFLVVAVSSLRKRMVWLASHEGGVPAKRGSARAQAVAKVDPTPVIDPSAVAAPVADEAALDAVANAIGPVVIHESSREVGDRPVLWRELRRPMFQRSWMKWLAFVAAGGIMLWIYAEAGIFEEGSHTGTIVGLWVVWGLMMLSMSTSAIVAEREGQTWPALVSTALSPREILAGMVAGFVSRQRILAAFMAVAVGIAIIAGMARPVLAVHAVMVVMPTVLFIGVVGANISMRKKTTASIASIAVAIGFALWAAPWVLLGVSVGVIGFDDKVAEPVAFVLLLMNPFGMLGVAVDGAMSGRSGVHYETPLDYLSTWQFSICVAIFAAVYLAASAGLFAWTVARFRRLNRQSS